MCHINAIQYGCGIIRIYIADKLCLHFESAVLLCPVFQCQIHGSRAKVTAADTDLNNRSKLFSCCIRDIPIVNLVGEFCDTLLLLLVESTLVHAICDNCIPQLTTGHVMQDQTFLSCIDNFAIVKSFKFLCQLRFISQFLQCVKHSIIYLLCCIVVNKSLCHRHTVFFNALCAFLSGHCLRKIHTGCLFQLLIGSKSIQVIPGNHILIPPSIHYTDF